jgi:hypothetical protein
MNEKKFTYLLVSAAALAILIVILVNIPWGGDKAAIRKEYDLESNEHVFETISFENMMEKINKNETFQVYVGSTKHDTEAKQFVYETNKLAKTKNIKTIYYLDLSKLSTGQLDEIKIESNENDYFPTMIYFEGSDDFGRSVATNISGLKDYKVNYKSNWSILITEYFEDCYN